MIPRTDDCKQRVVIPTLDDVVSRSMQPSEYVGG